MASHHAHPDLRAEAALDPDIQFTSGGSSDHHRSDVVLLTGASGFIGAFLVSELLADTGCTVFCLLRDSDERAARLRLRRHLESFGLWQDSWELRIVPILGDLSQPRLGLDASTFDALAAEIDVIYHNGALVNFARPYSTLKATNVLGTHEILRLAGRWRTKPVHFISSLAVFFGQKFSPEDVILETDVADPDDLSGGYQQSKWVAEQLIRNARARGLRASIYRVGRVTGHSRTGATGNFDDLLYRMLGACIGLGTYPDSDAQITMIAVDYFSRAVVHLSRQAGALDTDFHIIHPSPIRWNDLLELVNSLGMLVRKESYEAWLHRLQSIGRKHSDYARYQTLLLSLRMRSSFFQSKPRFDSGNTRRHLAGSGIDCPPIDSTLMTNYLNYMKEHSFLGSPA